MAAILVSPLTGSRRSLLIEGDRPKSTRRLSRPEPVQRRVRAIGERFDPWIRAGRPAGSVKVFPDNSIASRTRNGALKDGERELMGWAGRMGAAEMVGDLGEAELDLRRRGQGQGERRDSKPGPTD